MRLTFLGTGTSSGVPAIGCECTVCTSADPRDARLRTSAALRWVDPSGRERVLLLDAGPDLRAQSLREGLKRSDAIFFTHNHVDHTFGLDEVRRFNAVQRAPIDIYAEPPTLEHLRRVYKHIFESHKNVNDSFVAAVIAHEVSIDRPLHLHGVEFTPIRLLHGRLPIVGWRVEGEKPDGTFPLAYCTDVSAIPTESWSRLRGLQTLVLDALRDRKHPTHFTLEESVSAAANIAAQSTWFVHMSHDLGHAETDERLPEGMRLAYDGLVLG